MSLSANPGAKQAFTLIELVVAIAIIFIIFSLAWPTHRGVKVKAKSIQCMSNLKQIALGYALWAEDQINRFPWEVSTNFGGSLERVVLGNAVDQITPLTNFLRNPVVFACPGDSGRQRTETYVGFTSTNLSYFAAVHASAKPSVSPAGLILAGDRCLSFKNQPVRVGLFETTNSAALGWQEAFHKTSGGPRSALAFVDGHCEDLASARLSIIFQAQGNITNRLVIP